MNGKSLRNGLGRLNVNPQMSRNHPGLCVLIVSTLQRLQAITFRHDAQRVPALNGITAVRTGHNAFIFFQWLVIPASGPFPLIGYVSSLLPYDLLGSFQRCVPCCKIEGVWGVFRRCRWNMEEAHMLGIMYLSCKSVL